MSQTRLKQCLLFLLLLISCGSVHAQRGLFLTAGEYRDQVFAAEMPFQMLWINKEQRHTIETILGHSFGGLRIRYWGQADQTAWIFEEIGKELPITVGVSVNSTGITDLTILEYREVRGGEVRYPFFTSQFKGAALEPDLTSEKQPPKINNDIDGITGATLSVRALKKIAALALYCHQLTPYYQEQASKE